MNIQYNETLILKSTINFSKLIELGEYKGECHLTASLGIPKDLNEDKIIKCKLNFKFVEPDCDSDCLINLQTINNFEVSGDIDSSLDENVRNHCVEYSYSVLIKKIEELSEICIGQKITLPEIEELTE